MTNVFPGPSSGNAIATGQCVQLIEFGDFICPKSRQVRHLIADVVELFGDQLLYQYRYFPLLENDASLLAALAAEAANRQGQFGAMYQALFTLPVVTCQTLSALALQLGLDQHRFLQDLLDDALYEVVKTDWLTAYKLGIHTTPTLFVGGQLVHGKLTQARLIPLIQVQVTRYKSAVLSTVDPASGTINWNTADFGA